MNKIARVILIAASAVFAHSTVGSPITYDFTVNGGATGPLAGVISTGSFTFDSSIIPAGGGFVSATGLFEDLNFTWNGITYTAATANTGALNFNAAGTINDELFGNVCGAGGCSVMSGFNQWDLGPTAQFNYSLASQSTAVFNGSSALRGPISVPEPGSIALLSVGLVGLGVSRRRGLSPKA